MNIKIISLKLTTLILPLFVFFSISKIIQCLNYESGEIGDLIQNGGNNGNNKNTTTFPSLFQVDDSRSASSTKIRITSQTPSWCPYKCYDMRNCELSECQSCQVNCVSKICSYQKLQTEEGIKEFNKIGEISNECAPFCKAAYPKTFCEFSSCKGCGFCLQYGCSIVNFEDVTHLKFRKFDKYWQQWKHSGKPYLNEGAPLFVDLNNDGVLDYFNSMHSHGVLKGEKYLNRMELAESLPIQNSTQTYLQKVSERILTGDKYIGSIDTHGQNILDLDNDGIVDLLVSSGGFSTATTTSTLYGDYVRDRDNFLFWGKRKRDHITGKKVTKFRGGREAALEAKIHMRLGRGRINYMLDVNRDGLIDIFSVQDRPKSNLILPGVLLINQGNRKWKKDPSMQEYTRSMILTDADGDGFAEEILISRGFCYPQRAGPGTDPEFPQFGPFPNDVIQFCKTRPVGSFVVYKWNTKLKQMVNISLEYNNALPIFQPACCKHGEFSGANNCHVRSIASGFLDHDEIVDHIYLYQSKMVFYFSTDRPKNALPIQPRHISKEIYFPTHCNSALTIRLVDFDNDGKQEIFIACENDGVYLIYSQGTNTKDWKINNNECNRHGSLFPLGNMKESSYTQKDLEESCNIDSSDWKFPGDLCNYYKGVGPYVSTRTAGISTVDLNNDGFIDVVASYHGGLIKFYHNVPTQASKENHFIAFQLKGRGSWGGNKYGIGAVVTLTFKYNGKVSWQKREISSYQHTTDMYGNQDDRIIFGLGSPKSRQLLYVVVQWPNRERTRRKLRKWKFSKNLKPMILKQQ